ncbi:MAG: hypothetical protein ACI86H_001130, partial [bacterium]
MLHCIIFLILEVLIVIGSLGRDLTTITPWLLGINFTTAIFSINFTFFSYQLSKYKAIYSKITKRQWFDIVLLLVLPFLPLVFFLYVPKYFGMAALWLLPILALSSIDSASLTSRYLNPTQFIKNSFSDKAISQYLDLISKEVNKEVDNHQVYLSNKGKFQIPSHAYDFEPEILGLEPIDMWDSIAVITKLSIENNDYPICRQAINAILKLVLASYSFKFEGENTYQVDSGIKIIAQKRLHSIISYVVD